ncbi:hypothetical protein EDC04DRAFT_2864599 [Pisolithus marmoratus]|nr:hypothetical protein EDC04DRAFT_2864599 [Pisolithus marmoratus]
MVESILQYCNTCVREIIEGVPHFHTPNWASLKDTLFHYFDADIFDEQFFEKDLKALVSSQLKQKDPNLDVSTPFPYDEVCKAAEEVLYDLDLLGPRPISTPSDQQNEAPHHTEARGGSVQPLLPPNEARTNLEALEREGSKARQEDEVETLIKSLSYYPLLYYRAIKIDPDALKVIHPPVFQNPPVSATPITPPSTQPCPLRKPITCFGCGVIGHGVDSCDAINDLVRKGSLSRDDNHQIIFPNGQCIYRNGDEMILQAYE